ncbi:MAG: ABC transporter permease subunit [Actinomycetota bacterium]|nr:ABC transporter permease subunit [Actinomycetota bacterium]
MRSLRAITGATIRQVLGLRRAIIFGLAALAPALVFLLTAQALVDEAALDRFLSMVVGLYFPLLVPIVALIISASALGDERRDGTLSFLVLRPIPRLVISGSKFLGAVLVASGLNALGGAALGIVYGIETGSWDVVTPLVVGGIVASMVYASLFVPLGFFTDRAVLIGLAFVFIFENGVVSALSGLSSLSPWRVGMSAFSGLVPDSVAAQLTDIGIADLSGLGSTLSRTVIITALSIAATTLVLRRRDLA